MPFVLRSPKPAELPWLAGQLGAAYHETHLQDIGADPHETDIVVDLLIGQPLLAYTENGPTLVLVAEDTANAEVAGAVMLSCHLPSRCVQAVLMWVRPDYRGLGLVRLLLGGSDIMARNSGAARFDAAVAVHKPQLQRVYERWGFQVCGHLMSKRL